MKHLLCLLLSFSFFTELSSQELIEIDQDYVFALSEAKRTNKLLLIDFYTVWCRPCKQFDKLVFQKDSVRQALEKDFVLLKYDAEKDSVFHLAKKHHVVSYPTGIVLSPDGYVLDRIYGFKGNDYEALKNSLFGFTENAKSLYRKGEFLKGYNNVIDVSIYPQIYMDAYHRKKLDKVKFDKYWNTETNTFDEAYFSSIVYFAKSNLPEKVAETFLRNKGKYQELYGENDVNVTLYFLSTGLFNKAIENLDQDKFKYAEDYIKRALSEEWTSTVIPQNKMRFLQAQGKWDEIVALKQSEIDNGKLNAGGINNFAWLVYMKCDDTQSINQVVDWMKGVVDKEPIYLYMDTYAFLLKKAGRIQEAKVIAEKAIKLAKKEGESTKKLEKILQMKVD